MLDACEPPQICLCNSQYSKTTLPYPLLPLKSTACLYLMQMVFNFKAKMFLFSSSLEWGSFPDLSSRAYVTYGCCTWNAAEMLEYLLWHDSQSTFPRHLLTLYLSVTQTRICSVFCFRHCSKLPLAQEDAQYACLQCHCHNVSMFHWHYRHLLALCCHMGVEIFYNTVGVDRNILTIAFFSLPPSAGV